ncbi:hypothetical protein Leryth_012443 [Lithospermum erythrorhizon]|nr:hypothetical protein Leryth_012443 [Lithospermum erythrorhizon]
MKAILNYNDCNFKSAYFIASLSQPLLQIRENSLARKELNYNRLCYESVALHVELFLGSCYIIEHTVTAERSGFAFVRVHTVAASLQKASHKETNHINKNLITRKRKENK